MAFVVVQHLDPNHKSILTDLIGRYTNMPVYEVEDGMVVQPNCVYVIPPKYDMILEYGTLQLLEPTEPHGHHLPIDLFFRSLAEQSKSGPSALCSRVPAATAHWEYGRSKPKAAW